MLGTYAQNKTRVDKATLDKAAEEVLGKELPSAERPMGTILAAGAGVLVLLVLGVWFLLAMNKPDEGAVQVERAAAFNESASAPVQSSQSFASYPNEASALSALFIQLGLPELSGPAPCDATQGREWQCQRMAAKNWQSFIDINRPSVLRLVDSQGLESFVVILSLSGVDAQVLYEGSLHTYSLIELGQMWSGEFAFVWQGPDSFVKPLALGDSGEVITWLAKRFALLDGQENVLADTEFNQALSQRVILFQREHGLDDDGIVGVKTLLKLNALLDQAVTLDASVGEGA